MFRPSGPPGLSCGAQATEERAASLCSRACWSGTAEFHRLSGVLLFRAHGSRSSTSRPLTPDTLHASSQVSLPYALFCVALLPIHPSRYPLPPPRLPLPRYLPSVSPLSPPLSPHSSYFTCADQELTGINFCPRGSFFDVSANKCQRSAASETAMADVDGAERAGHRQLLQKAPGG